MIPHNVPNDVKSPHANITSLSPPTRIRLSTNLNDSMLPTHTASSYTTVLTWATFIA